jgi:pimeloyl-ACP methyl ester carboxylesterase
MDLESTALPRARVRRMYEDRRMRPMVTMAIALCLAACNKKSEEPAAKITEAPKVAAGERWAATLVVGANLKDFVVAFANGTAAFEGLTKDPLPLADVTLAPDRLAFTLKKSQGSEVYALARTGDTAKGEVKIGAHTLQIRMVKLADGEAPHSAYPRPQTPRPPFPYEQREVVIDAPDGGKLAGTLTLPKGVAHAPAVLFWSGSGQQDRDETIFGHKPYLILSDRLTRAGLATLRLDDRGTGKTTGAVGTLDTEIADAGAAMDFLAKQPEVDPKKLGMIAHSTGGMVAPNVALAHPVAFVVSLAGVAVPGRELVLLQQQAMANATGTTVPPEQVALQKKLGEASLKGADEVKRVLVEVAGPQLEKALGHKPTQDEIDKAIAKPLADVIQPWALSFFRIDPRDAWKKLTIPVLLVVGDHDTQVPADATIAALTGAHGKPDAVTTKKLPGLNHLFQHAKTGLTDEYVEIDESFDPATLEIIATWLAAR